jgi:hypothetical protein
LPTAGWTALDNLLNVNARCTLPATETDGGYNRCYNHLALGYHNQRRALREGTKNLVLDPRIAKHIQKEMDKTGFAGKIADRGAFAACGESRYTRDSASTKTTAVEFTNEASEAWYAGHLEYDAVTGK